MIYDADAHITLTEANGNTVDALLRQMDAAGIDRALVWQQPPYFRDVEAANRYVYESARAHPDRLTPFGWADPHFGIPASLDTIRRCLEEYGMPGIKLNGAQNAFYIDDEAFAGPLIDAIDQAGAALALHIGADFYEFTHPFRAAKIAQRHPNLRMLIAHLGGAGVPDLGDACIEFAAQHPNMLLIGSAISYQKVLKAIRALGPGRLCFGSDTPFAIPKVEVAAYRALLEDELSEADRARVMSGNIDAFLRKEGDWA
ncbi:amidohydrolase [Eubacteriales bacterium OttesenSCG-928-A19]|nr:amidohydrolase [Eubacteriales bacterium OttesenSCG-928-A19]